MKVSEKRLASENSAFTDVLSASEPFDQNNEILPPKYDANKQAMRRGKWLKEEDDILRVVVPHYGGKHWKKIAEHVPGRTPIQCLHRWTKILQPSLVKGPWTQAEDKKLEEFVDQYGDNQWQKATLAVPGRSAKQCKERWLNVLNPSIKKGGWSLEEDMLIFKLYNLVGPHWSKIAREIPERTENAIKNRFYSSLRRIQTEKKRRKCREEMLHTEVTIQGLDVSALQHIPALAETPEHEKALLILQEQALRDIERRRFDFQNGIVRTKQENEPKDLNEYQIQQAIHEKYSFHNQAQYQQQQQVQQ